LEDSASDNLTTLDVARAQVMSALAILSFSLDQEITLTRHERIYKSYLSDIF